MEYQGVTCNIFTGLIVYCNFWGINTVTVCSSLVPVLLALPNTITVITTINYLYKTNARLGISAQIFNERFVGAEAFEKHWKVDDHDMIAFKW